ncbi:hypothetical protein QTN24_11920 [Cupriavidus sp. SZY C1]|nr:hypothetical protein [Cupriavidus sp. SZY C1]
MSTPSDVSPSHQVPYRVHPATGADGPLLDAWLQARAPLPVPEARARRLSLDALLAQGGEGLCLVGRTSSGQPVCLMPVTLVHSLALGGRVAMVAEWWPPADPAEAAEAWRDACCAELADWCRAHGIRHIRLAPTLVADAAQAPDGFRRDADGLWTRSLLPTPKQLG